MKNSFNIEKWSEILRMSSDNPAVSSSPELIELTQVIGLNLGPNDSPFSSLIKYFNLQFNRDNVLDINDTQLSTVVMRLLYIRQQQGQLILFSNTGWNTIDEPELNRIIIAISAVILEIKPPSSSKLRQVLEYLQGNAPGPEDSITRD